MKTIRVLGAILGFILAYPLKSGSAEISLGQTFGTLVTRKGEQFREVVVTGISDGGIKISHSDGIATIAFEDLPNSTAKDDTGLNKSIVGRKIDRLVTTSNAGKSLGAIYSNVTVVKIEPDGLTIKSDGGLSKINYKDLPAKLREECRFDTTEADNYTTSDKQKQSSLSVQGKQWETADGEQREKILTENAARVREPEQQGKVGDRALELFGKQKVDAAKNEGRVTHDLHRMGDNRKMDNVNVGANEQPTNTFKNDPQRQTLQREIGQLDRQRDELSKQSTRYGRMTNDEKYNYDRSYQSIVDTMHAKQQELQELEK